MRPRLVFGLLLCCALVLAVGCNSGPKFAPVSGKVTMNGKPLAGAFVSFQPITTDGSAKAPAPGSSGKTNANGEYTLKVSTGEDGAWVGRHKVMIEAHSEQVESDARPPRGGWPLVNKVPPQYNTESTVTFDVPPEGTNQANFEIQSAPPSPGKGNAPGGGGDTDITKPKGKN
jgi:hypothetical protein